MRVNEDGRFSEVRAAVRSAFQLEPLRRSLPEVEVHVGRSMLVYPREQRASPDASQSPPLILDVEEDY